MSWAVVTCFCFITKSTSHFLKWERHFLIILKIYNCILTQLKRPNKTCTLYTIQLLQQNGTMQLSITYHTLFKYQFRIYICWSFTHMPRCLYYQIQYISTRVKQSQPNSGKQLFPEASTSYWSKLTCFSLTVVRQLEWKYCVFMFYAWLVDRPTQLVYIGISICWVGGGNPCGVADFCLSGVYCYKKQARSDFFSKCPSHVHKDCLEAQNGTKNWVKPLKNLFFSSHTAL